jgi:hypothetical protein
VNSSRRASRPCLRSPSEKRSGFGQEKPRHIRRQRPAGSGGALARELAGHRPFLFSLLTASAISKSITPLVKSPLFHSLLAASGLASRPATLIETERVSL